METDMTSTERGDSPRSSRRDCSRRATPETAKALVAILDRRGTLFNGTAPEELVHLCRKLENERDEAREALLMATQWGISSDAFSAEVGRNLRVWVIGGMEGPPPKVPDYYPSNAGASLAEPHHNLTNSKDHE